MNTLVSSRRAPRGSALLVTVVVMGLIGFLLAAYLSLVKSQNHATFRSQVWNMTMAVVEAGIEDALAHLTVHGSTNLICDGWTQDGSTVRITRAVGENYYQVTITNWVAGASNNAPVIQASAYVAAPLTAAAPSSSPWLLASAGGGTPSVTYIARGVRVTTKQDFIFTKGMVARDTIDLNGNNIKSDSFDSSDPLYSTNGLYSSSKRKDSGDIATNSSLTNSLSVGNADIYGRVSTGPNGTVDIGPQGSVGDLAWVNGNNHGIKAGWSSDDMNVSFPDVQVPFGGGAFAPSGGWITNNGAGTYYNYILDDGNYQLATLNGTVYVRGQAKLYVTTSLNMSGLVVQGGKKLDLYSGAPSVSLSGNNTANSDATADSFAFWGLPACTSVSFSGNASFTGTIYAPNAAFTLNGGGNNTIDFIGASITKSVRMNGHFNFHYDEALKKFGPHRGWVVSSWSEMTPGQIPPLAGQ
jgi:hypothetical protein